MTALQRSISINISRNINAFWISTTQFCVFFTLASKLKTLRGRPTTHEPNRVARSLVVPPRSLSPLLALCGRTAALFDIIISPGGGFIFFIHSIVFLIIMDYQFLIQRSRPAEDRLVFVPQQNILADVFLFQQAVKHVAFYG